MTDHKKLLDYVESFVEKTHLGHEEARTRRSYVNNQQWTEEEKRKIRARKQPVITDNAIKRKTDYFLGIERQTRTDPKAYPRTPDHDEAGEAFTDALRFVCDNNDWDIERSEGFDCLIVEGIEGYIVATENVPDRRKGMDVNITLNHIPWDRIIYDPHSRDRFFRDCKYKGVVTWMDEVDVLEMFPDAEEAVSDSYRHADHDDVFDDRPNKAVWTDKKRKRLKVIQLYYQEKGAWKHAVFTQGGFLVEPEDSPYHDEFGRPDCPIELAGAYIDKDNDRYGLVQDMISLSDMNNKLLSKSTHILNSSQTWGNQQGPEAKEAKKAAQNPNGHFELTGKAKFGEDFGIIPTDNKAMQVQGLLQYVRQSLDQIGGNSMVGGSESGRSKEIDQQTKNMELGPVLDTHRQCSKHVYRQIWSRIKQFWTDERWIRVTDDEDNLKWVSLNRPQTYREALEAKFGQVPPQAEGDPNLDQPRLDEMGNPVLVQNDVAEIDVDIIIEDAPDIINIQQEQFSVMAKLAETYGPEHVPFEEVLKLSTLRNKDAFIERTKGSEQQQAQAAQQAQQDAAEQKEIQRAMVKADLQLKGAQAAKTAAEAQKIQVEATGDGGYQVSKLDTQIRAQELQNDRYKVDVGAQVDLRKAEIKRETDIAVARIRAESGIVEEKIQSDSDITEKHIDACADVEVAKINKAPDVNAVVVTSEV